jgi:hypothetical protein
MWGEVDKIVGDYVRFKDGTEAIVVDQTITTLITRPVTWFDRLMGRAPRRWAWVHKTRRAIKF